MTEILSKGKKKSSCTHIHTDTHRKQKTKTKKTQEITRPSILLETKQNPTKHSIFFFPQDFGLVLSFSAMTLIIQFLIVPKFDVKSHSQKKNHNLW